MRLLDELAHPEILERSNLSPDDVARAIGPSASREEIEDLYRWIKKLETKRSKKASRTSKAPLMEDEEAPADASSVDDASIKVNGGERGGTVGRRVTIFSSPPPSSQPANNTEIAEMKVALQDLQGQVADMKRLLEQLVNNKNNNNNNNNNNSDQI